MSKVHIHLTCEFDEPLTLEGAQALREQLKRPIAVFCGRVTDIRTTPGRPEPWEQMPIPGSERFDVV